MLEKIRFIVLMLLGIFCITAYVVNFSGPDIRPSLKRDLASEDELNIID